MKKILFSSILILSLVSCSENKPENKPIVQNAVDNANSSVKSSFESSRNENMVY